MTSEQLDDMIDNAVHGAFNTLPDGFLMSLAPGQRDALLYAINDAIAPVLTDAVVNAPKRQS